MKSCVMCETEKEKMHCFHGVYGYPDGIFYCSDCVASCQMCQRIRPKENLNYCGICKRYICPYDCRFHNFRLCECCQKSVECVECFNEMARSCSCGKDWVCQKCISNCHLCGIKICKDHQRNCLEGKHTVCENCWDKDLAICTFCKTKNHIQNPAQSQSQQVVINTNQPGTQDFLKKLDIQLIEGKITEETYKEIKSRWEQNQ